MFLTKRGEEMHTIQAGFTRREISPISQGYEFKPKKYHWLAKRLWWLLHKLDSISPHFGEMVTYTFTRHHEGKLAEYIIQNKHQDYDLYENPKDYCLIMGRKDFHELMDNYEEMLRFSDLGTHRAYPIGYKGSYMGIPIHVVNTMEGFAVIPKVLIEKNSVF